MRAPNVLARALALVVGLVAPPSGAAPPGSGAPRPAGNGTDQALLKKLAIPAHGSALPSDERLDQVQGSAGRGLGDTVRLLQRRPWVNRPVLFSPGERAAMERHTIAQRFTRNGAKLSPPHIQARVDTIHASLAGVVKNELGGADAGHFAVIEGGTNELSSAVSLANGSVIVHRRILTDADHVGAAIASAHDPSELLSNIRDVARGKFEAPADVDHAEAKKYADAFLATAIGHEMAHGLRDHGATGRMPGSDPKRGVAVRADRAKELTADAGGLELATRAGYSVVGQAALPIYLTMLRAGHDDGPSSNHPEGTVRYDFAYRYLQKERPRFVYEGGDRQRTVLPSIANKTELERLPTPAAVGEAARALAVERREAGTKDASEWARQELARRAAARAANAK